MGKRAGAASISRRTRGWRESARTGSTADGSARGTFLREFLQKRWLKVDWINTGSLRGDLSDLCDMLFHHFAGSEGKLGFHMQLNMARYETVAEALSPYTDEVKARAR